MLCSEEQYLRSDDAHKKAIKEIQALKQHIAQLVVEMESVQQQMTQLNHTLTEEKNTSKVSVALLVCFSCKSPRSTFLACL